ncbi:DUF2268 domain-containing protein [Bacillus songklensis]|uniref:DUF2268 domain-containing protein n=1 Tax=Bacillus songklensis TaxID=1069116 RepID=A0ABV8B2F5_9BACI
MPIVATDEWLAELVKRPHSFVQKLTAYFPEVSAKEVIPLLVSHGMFHVGKEPPMRIEAFTKQNLWKMIAPHYNKLQTLWSGPDIPVLLFPSNSMNRRIQREFNGKSGVAFSDKLFLFANEDIEKNELLAVLTHEYHHICRLKAMKKKEGELTLLDTLVMEGLAEHAVKEQVGKQYLAPWTNYYQRKQAAHYWNKYIKPNRHIKKEERKHDELLYGMRWYPKMVGYSVGFHLVAGYTEARELPSGKLLHVPAEEIAAKSGLQM